MDYAQTIEKIKRDYISEGILIGRDEGILIGRDEGILIGRDEGVLIGRDEGKHSQAVETAKVLKKMGLRMSAIAKATGLSIEEINEL